MLHNSDTSPLQLQINNFGHVKVNIKEIILLSPLLLQGIYKSKNQIFSTSDILSHLLSRI